MASCVKRKDSGTVRAQMRQVVGDLENVLGELKTVVGDLRVLVTQIDAVTDKIDRQCGDNGANSCSTEQRRRLSAPVQASPISDDHGSRSASLRHSMSHSCDMGRREIDQPLADMPPAITSRASQRLRSKSHVQSFNKTLGPGGKRSPTVTDSHSRSHSKPRSHSVNSLKSSASPNVKVDDQNNNNDAKMTNFNVEKYQISPDPCLDSKSKKGSSSSNSSGHTRVVGKRRKIGPKLALSLPGTGETNSKVDSTSSRCSTNSLTDDNSQDGETHPDRKHIQCSPCSPLPAIDYCGIYERELDLKLEFDFQYDDVLEVYSTLGSTRKGELQVCGIPLVPPYDHDINTWTQYTVDFLNSNNYGLHLDRVEDPYSDTASDLLSSSEDCNIRVIPKTANSKFVNYSWRTVIKP